MARDALAVIEEFCEHGDARVRRNAATALAGVGTGNSYQRLLDMAIKDPDADVRAGARKEIELAVVDRDRDRAAALGTVFDGRLGEPERRAATYALMGELPPPAVDKVVKPRRFREQVRLAWELLGESSELASWPTRGRWLGSACVSVLCAGVILLLLVYRLSGSHGDLGDMVPKVLLAMAAALGWMLLGTARSTPTSAQYYRRAAIVVELARTTLVGTLLAMVVVFPLTSGEDTTSVGPIIAVLCACLAVRIGTFPRIAVKRWPWSEAVLRTWVGALLGLVVLTIMPGFGETEASRKVRSEIWPLFAMIAAGVANLYARIETGRSRRTPAGARRGAGVASWLLAGAGIAALLLLLGIGRSREVTIHAGVLSAQPLELRLGSSTTIVDFTIPGPGEISARADGRLALEQGGRSLGERTDVLSHVIGAADEGAEKAFQLNVKHQEEVDPDHFMDIIVPRVRRPLSGDGGPLVLKWARN